MSILPLQLVHYLSPCLRTIPNWCQESIKRAKLITPFDNNVRTIVASKHTRLGMRITNLEFHIFGESVARINAIFPHQPIKLHFYSTLCTGVYPETGGTWLSFQTDCIYFLLLAHWQFILSVCRSVRPSVNPSIHPFIYLSIYSRHLLFWWINTGLCLLVRTAAEEIFQRDQSQHFCLSWLARKINALWYIRYSILLIQYFNLKMLVVDVTLTSELGVENFLISPERNSVGECFRMLYQSIRNRFVAIQNQNHTVELPRHLHRKIRVWLWGSLFRFYI